MTSTDRDGAPVGPAAVARFRPDAAVAAAARRRMSESLHESLGQIGIALKRGTVALGRGAGEPVRPIVFAAYFDLLQAVLDDDPEGAGAALDRLIDWARDGDAPFLSGWSAFDAAQQACLLGHINADPTTRVELWPPLPEQERTTFAAISAGMALLDGAAPELAAEIRALVSQVIVVAGRVNGGEDFNGATSFCVTGALFLNAERHRDRIAAVEGLSHEGAHALLFAHSSGAPLVENPDDETHGSPLRSDPRPLDGIFHATFVSARMHHALGRVLAEGGLDPAEAEDARRRRADSRIAFDDGLVTLRRHARMTALGQALLDAAVDAMAEAAP